MYKNTKFFNHFSKVNREETKSIIKKFKFFKGDKLYKIGEKKPSFNYIFKGQISLFFNTKEKYSFLKKNSKESLYEQFVQKMLLYIK